MLQQNSHLRELWNSYQQKYSYAKDITYENICNVHKTFVKLLAKSHPINYLFAFVSVSASGINKLLTYGFLPVLISS